MLEAEYFEAQAEALENFAETFFATVKLTPDRLLIQAALRVRATKFRMFASNTPPKAIPVRQDQHVCEHEFTRAGCSKCGLFS